MTELKDVAENFVLVGAQAMALSMENPRFSKDFDFLLDVIVLRGSQVPIAGILEKLEYEPDPKAMKFQFNKTIPPGDKIMRIEFMASDKEKRPNDIRVDVQPGVHAFSCVGSEIVLRESDEALLEGNLPDGKPASVMLRYAKPNAVLMLKLLAMDDRFHRNRGGENERKDRLRAQVHCVDCIRIVHTHIRKEGFSSAFWNQFEGELELQNRCTGILTEYFSDATAPGARQYREFMATQNGAIDESEIALAVREMRALLEKRLS